MERPRVTIEFGIDVETGEDAMREDRLSPSPLPSWERGIVDGPLPWRSLWAIRGGEDRLSPSPLPSRERDSAIFDKIIIRQVG